MKQIEDIYNQFHKQIFGYFYHLTYNSDLSSELTQETFYQVIISIPRFKGDSKLSTWIYSIARNTYLKKIKKESKYLLTEEKVLYNLIPPDTTNNPELILEQHENKQKIKKIFSKLSENYASILILRDKNGLSYKEISQITGMSDSSVKVTLFRARQKFKELYSQNEGGE